MGGVKSVLMTRLLKEVLASMILRNLVYLPYVLVIKL